MALAEALEEIFFSVLGRAQDRLNDSSSTVSMIALVYVRYNDVTCLLTEKVGFQGSEYR